MYHPRIPRTIQLSTARRRFQFVKFTKQLVYKVQPLAGNQHILLCIRANSIGDIMVQNGSAAAEGTFTAQGADYQPNKTGPAPVQPVTMVENFSSFANRYQHFTVLGSKCDASYMPIGTVAGEPATFYLGKGGITNQVQQTNNADFIMKLPYYKRAQVLGASSVGFGVGKRLFSTYSAKRFEGVRDVADNNQLRGRFPNTVTADTLNQPGEQSFYYCGLVNTVPNSGQTGPPGILRVRMQYIVKLTEPTNTNINHSMNEVSL